MVTSTYKHRRVLNVLRLALILQLTISLLAFSQTSTDDKIELPKEAVANLLLGIQSDNYGLKTSSIYFAGKYKVIEAAQKLIKEINNSNDDDLSLMVAWSLFRIGDDSCCKELSKISNNHPSADLRAFCSKLHDMKQFELAIVSNL